MKIFIACCLILLCSCNHKDDTISYIHSDDFTICHYQNVKDTAYINLSDLIEEFKIVRFDNIDTAIFNYRSTPTITDHFIGIAQSRNAYLLFNNDGKFLNKVGNIGQGPGEYPMTIYDAIIEENENEIYLASFAFLKKILVYNMNGDFKYEIVTDTRLNKPKIRLGKDKSLSILHLPFENESEKTLAFQYNQVSELQYRYNAPSYLWMTDFNQDLFAYHNVPEFSFHITSCDTLYHYETNTNKLHPKFSIDFGHMDDPPIHIYNELRQYYVVTVFGAGTIFVDKEKKTAKYVKIINDFCGHMSEPMFNFKNGWAYRLFEPNYLINWIEKRLEEKDCNKEDREQLYQLLETIDEEDNNIMFIGKLKH